MHAVHRPRQLPSFSVGALVAAALCTAAQLAAVAALAEASSAPAPAGVRLVQLERVVVTGKRVAAADVSLPQAVAACEPRDQLQRC